MAEEVFLKTEKASIFVFFAVSSSRSPTASSLQGIIGLTPQMKYIGDYVRDTTPTVEKRSRPTTAEEAFKMADINGDGVVDRKEYAVFKKEMQGSDRWEYEQMRRKVSARDQALDQVSFTVLKAKDDAILRRNQGQTEPHNTMNSPGFLILPLHETGRLHA